MTSRDCSDASDRIILELIAEGASNHQIAKTMYIADATASRKVSSLMERFKANNRAHLVYRAIQVGALIVAAVADPSMIPFE